MSQDTTLRLRSTLERMFRDPVTCLAIKRVKDHGSHVKRMELRVIDSVSRRVMTGAVMSYFSPLRHGSQLVSDVSAGYVWSRMVPEQIPLHREPAFAVPKTGADGLVLELFSARELLFGSYEVLGVHICKLSW